MVGETTDDVACKGLPGKAMMTKDSQDVVAEENKQETTKLNNEGEDKEGPWIVVTNIKRRVGKGKEGNSGGHPRNGEGTSKTKGRYGKEIRGGTQLRTNLDLNNNRWRALAGKDQERERKGTEKQGNDLLSDKGKEVLRSEQKSGEHVGRSKKTALLIGERKSKSAIFEKEGLHGRFTSPQLPRSINTPSYQEVNTILSENLEPDISSCNGECSRSSPHSSETDLIFEEKSHDSLSLFDPSPTTKNAQPFPNFPHSFAVESPGIANDCREVIRAPVSLVPPHEVSAPQEGRTLDIRLRSGAKNSGTTQKPPSFHLKIRKPRSGGFKASKPDVNLHHRRKDRTVATRSGILPGSSNPPGNLDITGPKTRGYGDDTGCNGGSPSKEEGNGSKVVLRWKPPHQGFLKLNTDGAWKADWENAGIGGVFRDAVGNWELGFAKRVDAGSPEAAELMAIREGLQVAWDCNYHKLEVECDAKGVVQLLAKPLEAENHPLGVIVMDICILLTRHWSVEFLHIKREGNKVAHCLAAEAVNQVEERVIFINPPEHAKEVYFKDKEFVASSS
ncbi:hypothetical protein BVRB_4g073110 [Beta vulgaris subsp. vulgaris]|nr:hypothetical protein BVRB_4g073110 [Beta vulgaris subsp. vulgaris]